MALAVGARLGPFEILALIGAGAMGEVYQARDPRLNRIVAIKILSPDDRADLDRRRRFEREAQAIAALAHPNICVLYDVGREQDVDFLVMEYLEGETLATRLRRGPLPLDDVLRWGTQISDALGKAHRHGIVHRDLKPGNVMLTKGGIKLLDFGVARLRPTVAGTSSATATAPESLTAAEGVVGTLPYVAPEQLEGAPGDARSDIFALGAVLYEMVSGKRAFGSDSPASVIVAILNRQPEPLAILQPAVPAAFDQLVSKCLAKDPDARWQSASDVADALRWIGGGAESRHRTLSETKKRVTTLVAALAMAALLAATSAVFWRSRTNANRTADSLHQRVTFDGDVVSSALSPDGHTVAYATHASGGSTQVLVREMGGDRASVAWTGEQILSLSWTRDGSRLVVVGNRGSRGVWIVPLSGGTERLVSDFGKFAAASPDGTAIALTTETLAGFTVVPLAGGAARTVNMTGFWQVFAIEWHPRTNRIVLMTADDELKVWTIWSVDPDGGEPSRLLTGSDYFRALCTSPASDVVYAMRENRGTLELVRVPIYADPRSVRVLLNDLPLATMGYRCTVSADGRRLLYGRNDRSARLMILSLAPSTEAVLKPLTSAPGLFWFPDVSPDGEWVAATEGTEVRSDVVKIRMTGGDPVRLGEGAGPAWSSDGQQLAFTSRRSGSLRVWISGANGHSPKEVQDSATAGPRPVWLPDGRLAWQTPDRQNYNIRDLATGRDEYLLSEVVKSTSVSELVFSPRGDQVAMHWDWSGPALWLVSWPGRLVRRLAPHMTPFGWSVDGEWIYGVAYVPYPGPAIVRVSSKTGTLQRIKHVPIPLQATVCDLTSKGEAVVCSFAEEKSDAWMMQDFDRDAR
jgi:eukaryotic-like serine/threonine-protein kinase